MSETASTEESASEPIALETTGLEKRFGADDQILSGVDLSVREGERLLLMGPNGVGKTVLLSCLAGSEPPTDGSIEIFGDAVAGGSDRLDFMLQGSMLEPTLTGRENVAFYRDLHPQCTDRWRTYTERLGIADDLDDVVETYSEGMKRKLEFALTLSGEAPIYLLDEPTAGVDLHNVQQFHDIICTHHDRGKTIVISSHRPMDANVADRIAFMPAGTISAIGTPEELLSSVPPVVTVTGREAMTTATEFVRNERLFPVGGEARGFLAEGVDSATIERAIADGAGSVAETEPTYTDLFNYYIHVGWSE